MLRASEIYAHIRHALGNAPAAEIPVKTIANQAGHHLVTLHAWKFMERQARLNIRASITLTGATWTESTKTLTKTGAFTDYSWLEGDEVEITDGTGATPGFYRIKSKTSANAIVLTASIGAAADALTDMEGTMVLSSAGLPSDFAQLIGRPVHESSGCRLVPVTFQEILDARSGAGNILGWPYAAAIQYASSTATRGGAPVPRLELYMASSANSTAAITVHYRAGWDALDSDADLAPIPDYAEALYLQVARATALGYEEEDVASMDQRLAVITEGPIFASCLMRDGAVQTNLGEMRGGAVRRDFAYVGPGPFTVLPPS